MYRNHLKCRACGSNELVPVLDLGVQPLANDFRVREDEQAGFAPLKVMFCPRCTLAQLSVVVDPKILYARYSYVTSPSVTMRNHLDRMFDDLGVSECKSVVEVGSNDGRMLKQWTTRKPDLRVMGIDPAKNLCEMANASGITSFCGLMTTPTATAVRTVISPELVVARHCFCHADDWREFIHALSMLGHDRTRYVIEVPYVANQISSGDFGQIYHEHLSYLSVTAMNALLKDSPLYLDSVNHYPIHGGCIVMTLLRKNSVFGKEVTQPGELNTLLMESWVRSSLASTRRQFDLRDFVSEQKQGGVSVCGFGASAKSTVWLNACGFDKSDIAFLCDANPMKQGMLSPGSDIPVVGEEALLTEKPDYAINFAYGFTDEIVANNKAYLDAGGKFVVPLPALKVLGA